MSQTPPLQAPGAGLPLFEALLSRWVLFPLGVTFVSNEKAIQMLLGAGQSALAIARSLSPEQLTTPVLIPRIRGIEDSSRHWSVLMTIEHLLITGQSMTAVIETLAKNQSYGQAVRIEDVKPQGTQTPEDILNAYQAFLEVYPQRIAALGDLSQSHSRHPHPWFWNMTVHEWVCLNGFHPQIHLQQIHAILKQ